MSMFTRRHYVWLASAMRETISYLNNLEAQWGELKTAKETREEFIRMLAANLTDENGSFDKEQFLHNILCDPTQHPHECPFGFNATNNADITNSVW